MLPTEVRDLGQGVDPGIKAALVLDDVPHARDNLLIHDNVRDYSVAIYFLHDLVRSSDRIEPGPAHVQADHAVPPRQRLLPLPELHRTQEESHNIFAQRELQPRPLRLLLPGALVRVRLLVVVADVARHQEVDPHALPPVQHEEQLLAEGPHVRHQAAYQPVVRRLFAQVSLGTVFYDVSSNSNNFLSHYRGFQLFPFQLATRSLNHDCFNLQTINSSDGSLVRDITKDNHS